ncbi:MAG TPA: ABC transporter permease [Dehalococcoidia bacterium]|jgi:peptide/nickel transport system permease protein|nr:ABC transporter permease [Dehalococcoidia bacterium]
MRDFIIRRLLLLPIIIIGVSFITFMIFRVIPADAAVFVCQLQCTPETLHDIRHELELDRPFYEQYGKWLTGVVQGDLGTSFHTHLTVNTELERKYPVTLELLVLSLLLSLLLGIPAGILSAIRPGSIVDFLVRLISVFWLSIPSFYLAILIVTFGASWAGWSPPNFGTGRAVTFIDVLHGGSIVTNLETFLPAALVLSVGIAAVIMRLTRSSMLEVMRNDYIRTAYSKGLRERAVVWRHALKNAMIPVITIVGLQIGGLIGGSILVESVFALNGIGYYLLSAIVTRDLQVVQSLVLIFALAYVIINLIVDVSYAWLDPRIRYG